MSGIDNNFTNRYIQYKKDGISQAELQQVRNEVSTKGINTQDAKALTREIIKDGKIDQEEQKVLQAIGQGAKDISTAQKLASSIDPTNSEISKLIMLGFKNKAQAVTGTNKDVSKMGNAEKVVEAIKGSLKYVGPELRAKLEEMLTPQNLAIMGGVLATYAASHAVGVGFIADGLLFAAGALTLGKDAIDVAKKLYGFAKDAINAKNPQDLDRASRQFASATATVISDLPALIGMKNVKVSSKTVGIPVPSMKPVMSGGAAVLAPAISTATVTFPVIVLSKAKTAAIGASVMMSQGNGSNRTSGSGNSSTPKTGPNGVYEDASYHSSKGNSVKSKKPIDGQAALDKSIPLGGTSKRRIAYVNNEIVILDQTSSGKFHGHVRTWADLSTDMQNILIKDGLFKRNGKPVK